MKQTAVIEKESSVDDIEKQVGERNMRFEKMQAMCLTSGTPRHMLADETCGVC